MERIPIFRRKFASFALGGLLSNVIFGVIVLAPIVAEAVPVATCNGLAVTITGSGTINGTNGNDVILGSAAHDTIRGGNGNDTICAGGGNDTVYGENGNDHIYGEDGDDTVYGGDGNDDVYGGDGADVLMGGDDNDNLFGQNGHDSLYGENDNDDMDGGAGTDACHGGSGNDERVACEADDDDEGVIVIRKDAQPDSEQDFSFSVERSSGSPETVTLDDDAGASATRQNEIALVRTTGSGDRDYDVIENVVSGWSLASISCYDPGGSTTVNVAQRKAVIDLDAGEVVTCTFTNNANDSDGDGIPDSNDNCSSVSNPDQTDADADGVGDACDNCSAVGNADQSDTDGDTVGNVCDNCPSNANSSQADQDSDGTGDVCDAETCGNGAVEGEETCDDGNPMSGDGCSYCAVEPGYACSGIPSSCTTVCGDEIMTGSEACDDGNTANGDGCSSTCTTEVCSCDSSWLGDQVCDSECNTFACNWDGGDCNVCGDNVLSTGEECDDGNVVDGDGCSATCATESVIGDLILHKYECPASVTLSRESNGPDESGSFTVPVSCIPEANVQFGYTYQADKDDNSAPYAGASDGTPFTSFGVTGTDGALLVEGLSSVGRYNVAELDGNSGWSYSFPGLLSIFCQGDPGGGTDNYDITFIEPGGTVHCVAYNTREPVNMSMGFETQETLDDTEDGNPAMGFCPVTTADKTDNAGNSSNQVLKWTEVQGAAKYRITGYRWDGANWVAYGSTFTRDLTHPWISVSGGVVTYDTYATAEVTSAYFIEALSSDDIVLGSTSPQATGFTCTFTVDRTPVVSSSSVSSSISSSSSSSVSPTCSPEDENIIAYWKFDEGSSSSAADSTGNGHDGTLAGGAGWTSSVPTVAFLNSHALSFGGNGDTVNAGSFDEIEGSSSFTIALWAYQSSNHSATFVQKNRNDGFQLQPWSDGKIYFAVGGEANRAITSAGSYPLSSWYHVAGTYDGSTIRIFVNGAEVASAAKTTVVPADTAGLIMGASAFSDFDGLLDDVRIYSRVLSAGEIEALASGSCQGTTETSSASSSFSDEEQSSSESSVASSSSIRTLGFTAPDTRGKHGARRGRQTNVLGGAANFLSGMFFGTTNKGAPRGSHGTVAPGAFGGSVRTPLTADELKMICSMRKALPINPTPDMFEWLARHLSPLMNRSEEFLLDVLQDSALCEDAPKIEAKQETRKVALRVSADGYPLSKNPTWNACIRGSVTLQEIRNNPDKDEDGLSRDCGSYHTGTLWRHPDLSIYFSFDRKNRKIVVPDGVVVLREQTVSKK